MLTIPSVSAVSGRTRLGAACTPDPSQRLSPNTAASSHYGSRSAASLCWWRAWPWWTRRQVDRCWMSLMTRHRVTSRAWSRAMTRPLNRRWPCHWSQLRQRSRSDAAVLSAMTAAAAATTAAMTAITVSHTTMRCRRRFSLAEASSALVLRTSRRSVSSRRPAGRR
jgi:hypothetical protein